MISFIGNGNMGRAILGGILNAGLYQKNEITVADCNRNGLLKTAEQYGVAITEKNTEAAKAADVLVLAVKPQILYQVIEEIRDEVSESCLIISIAAGQSVEKIEKAFGHTIKLVRVMPNTPALAGEAMSALSPNKNITDSELSAAKDIFCGLGKAEIVPEHLMDAVTAVSGSSPAYVFMLIEAMADAAVAAGMPRAQSYTFAAQAVLGSAKMVLELGKHPGELKDMVCSPAGTTIAAVQALENDGFRAAIMNAMEACVERSQTL